MESYGQWHLLYYHSSQSFRSADTIKILVIYSALPLMSIPAVTIIKWNEKSIKNKTLSFQLKYDDVILPYIKMKTKLLVQEHPVAESTATYILIYPWLPEVMQSLEQSKTLFDKNKKCMYIKQNVANILPGIPIHLLSVKMKEKHSETLIICLC